MYYDTELKIALEKGDIDDKEFMNKAVTGLAAYLEECDATKIKILETHVAELGAELIKVVNVVMGHVRRIEGLETRMSKLDEGGESSFCKQAEASLRPKKAVDK